MRILAEVHLPDLGSHEVLDIDVTADMQPVAVIAVREGTRLVDRRVRLTSGSTVALPPDPMLGPPMVRALPGGSLLLVRARTRSEPNARILDRAGNELMIFNAGDAIEDIVVCGERIVVTYFDEGVFSHIPLSNEGASVFNIRGEFEFGHNSQTTGGGDPAFIADCYAACADEHNRLVIFPYTDFPIVRIDLEVRTREVFTAPAEVRGAHALSAADERVFLWSPYNHNAQVFETRFGSDTATLVGSIEGSMVRGLSGGRFLVRLADGFRIVTFGD